MEIKFGLISADSHAAFDRDDFTSRMSASKWSPATAMAMAVAVRRELKADYGIGIAGSASPAAQASSTVFASQVRPAQGGSMGAAYVAITGPNGSKEMEMRVPPRRITIKRRISNNALIELKKLITAAG